MVKNVVVHWQKIDTLNRPTREEDAKTAVAQASKTPPPKASVTTNMARVNTDRSA